VDVRIRPRSEAASLQGVSAAVTGGANGIGRAIAARLARAGARVAIGDLDLEMAQAAAREAGGDVFARALDVTQEDAFGAFLDAAEARHGPLGVLVNNAGVDWIGPFHEQPDAVARQEIAVNVYGTVLGSRLALARMLPRGTGHVVNIASGAGRVPFPGSATYAATKHAIVGLTESLRLEYRDSGVSFSVVQPVQVETGMLDGQARPRALPVITPDDVAAAVVDAIARRRFEVWVPGSQAVSARLGMLMPRRARDGVMRALGVTRIATGTDLAARRAYHERTFGDGTR
jgi:NAD(P)-dependent dehydrogenase (short-subunit alcohol dehydrogenase family)